MSRKIGKKARCEKKQVIEFSLIQVHLLRKTDKQIVPESKMSEQLKIQL